MLNDRTYHFFAQSICLSITLQPNPIAVIGANLFSEWSENPIGNLKIFLKVVILFKFNELSEHG